MISLLFVAVCSKEQTPVIAKTLTTTIYAAEKYESSKQQLLALMDSSSCSLISMNETKTDNGNQKIIIEFNAGNQAFIIIDNRLSGLGYISFKNLVTADMSELYDTAAITNDIIFLTKQSEKNTAQLTKLKPESSDYNQLWTKQAELETTLKEKQRAQVNAIKNISTPNKIHITIAE
jgi:hypothetical protein